MAKSVDDRGRGARLARRDEGAYCSYVTEEQRSQPGCIGREGDDLAIRGPLVGQDNLFQLEGEYAVRINDEFTLDIMPSACGHRFAELEPFIEERWLDGVRLPVLGLAGLLLTKEGMRDKDRADRRVIEQALAALKAGD